MGMILSPSDRFVDVYKPQLFFVMGCLLPGLGSEHTFAKVADKTMQRTHGICTLLHAYVLWRAMLGLSLIDIRK